MVADPTTWGLGKGGNEMVGPRSTEVVVEPFSTAVILEHVRAILCLVLADGAEI